MTDHPGKEALSRIIEAMNGVSAGRWCQFHPRYAEEAKGSKMADWDTSHEVSAVHEGVRKRIATFTHADDAAFVDAAYPDAIRSIAEYIEAVERERDEAREALKLVREWFDHISDDDNITDAAVEADLMADVQIAVDASLSSASLPPVEREKIPKVKALEWVNWEAQTILGRYSINRIGGDWEVMFYVGFSGVHIKSGSAFDHDHAFVQAKAAAQADYERRILSAFAGGKPE